MWALSFWTWIPSWPRTVRTSSFQTYTEWFHWYALQIIFRIINVMSRSGKRSRLPLHALSKKSAVFTFVCVEYFGLLMRGSFKIGHPTVLVNNAGVYQGKLLVDLKPEDIQQSAWSPFIWYVSFSLTATIRTFGVNTLAHFWTLKAFLPEMIKQNSGHIASKFWYIYWYLLMFQISDHHVFGSRYGRRCPK